MLRCSHWHHIPFGRRHHICSFIGLIPYIGLKNEASVVVVTLAPDSSAHLESQCVLNI